MKSGRLKSALRSKARSREDEAYEKRRWGQILDDLSNRPNLERAQAEAIVRKIVAVESPSDARKGELQKCLDDRFGRLEPVAAPAPAPAPTPVAKRRLVQGVLNPDWLEPQPVAGLPHADAKPEREQQAISPAPTRRQKLQRGKLKAKQTAELRAQFRAHGRARLKNIVPPLPVQTTSSEREFRRLVLRIGLDSAHAVIQNLKQALTPL